MGIFGSLFGKSKEYPPLEPGTPSSRYLDKSRVEVEPFVQKIKDKVELVPTENAIYAFVGNPPEAFGVAWLQDGKEDNIKALMQRHGLSQLQVQNLSDELRESYTRHQDEARFSTTVANRKVIITPSMALAQDVEKIIHAVQG